jgi:drug/metabolite transporter (DMT)-like permease
MSSPASPEQPRIRDWGLMLLVAATWGSLFVVSKWGLKTLSPPELIAIRYASSAALLTFSIIHALKRVKSADYCDLLLVAILGSGLPVYLMTLGQTQLGSATTGISNALTPMATVIVGLIGFGKSISRYGAVGLLLGLAGVACIVATPSAESTIGPSRPVWVYSLPLIATLSYGITAHMIRSRLKHVSAMDLTAMTFFVTGVPSAIWVLLNSHAHAAIAHSPAIALGIPVVLAILAITAIVGYYELIRVRGAMFGSLVTYLIPVVAVIWGIADGETVGWTELLGLAAILTGISLAGREAGKPLVSTKPLRRWEQ